MQIAEDQSVSTGDPRRDLAIKRIKAKNGFKIHLVVYLAVNAMLVVIWAFTAAGKAYPQGFFWPIVRKLSFPAGILTFRSSCVVCYGWCRTWMTGDHWGWSGGE
jgi:hypothetical protein